MKNITEEFQKMSKNNPSEILSREDEKSLDTALKSRKTKILKTEKDIENHLKDVVNNPKQYE